MANGYFGQLWYMLRKIAKVVEVQVVPSINAKTQGRCPLRCCHIGRNSRLVVSFCIRYKRYLVWLHFQHQVNKFLLAAIAFNIKFCGDYFFYLPYIVVTDMPFIWPGMYGYTVCPK